MDARWLLHRARAGTGMRIPHMAFWLNLCLATLLVLPRAVAADDSENATYDMHRTVHLAWTQHSPERMGLWYRSHQQCVWMDQQPNKYLSAESSGSKVRKPTRSGPYLSILLTTCNKDFNGQHFRISHFLKNVAAYTTKHNIRDKIELIFVDYNSDPTLPPLHEVSTLTFPPKNTLPLIRIITVGHAVHRKVNRKIKAYSLPGFWEYVAKNVAIRRACGEYVLITNADVWFSEGFWMFVAAQGFKPDMYYRMGRVDTKPNLTPDSLAWDLEQIKERMASGAFRICGPHHRQMSGGAFWFDREVNLPEDIKAWLNSNTIDINAVNDRGQILVMGCPGDFSLLSRDALMAMRGYPEVPLPTQLDDMILVQGVSMGLRCGVLPSPATMFHGEHDRSHQAQNEVWNAVGEKFAAIFGQSWNQLVDGTKPSDSFQLYNDDGWGLGLLDLPEVYV